MCGAKVGSGGEEKKEREKGRRIGRRTRWNKWKKDEVLNVQRKAPTKTMYRAGAR